MTQVRVKETFIHNSSRVRKDSEFDYETFYGHEIPKEGLEPWLVLASEPKPEAPQLEVYAGRPVVYPKTQHDHASAVRDAVEGKLKK